MVKATSSKRQKEAVLGEMENMLESTFKPVLPRPAYVKDLNRRLSNYPTPIPEVIVPSIPRDTAGVILGVIGGTALLILGIRVMIPLIANLTSLYGTRREITAMGTSAMSTSGEETCRTGFSNN